MTKTKRRTFKVSPMSERRAAIRHVRQLEAKLNCKPRFEQIQHLLHEKMGKNVSRKTFWRWKKLDYEQSRGSKRSFNQGAKPKFPSIEEGLRQLIEHAIQRDECVSFHRVLLEARLICRTKAADETSTQSFVQLKPTAQKSWIRRC